MELAKCRLCGVILYKTEGPICSVCSGGEPIVDPNHPDNFVAGENVTDQVIRRGRPLVAQKADA